jgi:hypothetical protein
MFDDLPPEISNNKNKVAPLISATSPWEKLGLNKTRLSDQSLDFGSVGESYSRSRVVFCTVFSSGETPRHAIGAVQ